MNSKSPRQALSFPSLDIIAVSLATCEPLFHQSRDHGVDVLSAVLVKPPNPIVNDDLSCVVPHAGVAQLVPFMIPNDSPRQSPSFPTLDLDCSLFGQNGPSLIDFNFILYEIRDCCVNSPATVRRATDPNCESSSSDIDCCSPQWLPAQRITSNRSLGPVEGRYRMDTQ